MNPFDSIVWDRDGGAIESESFRRIDAEADPRMRGRFSDAEWRVARRLVHTTADFSILPELEFSGGAVEAGLAAARSPDLLRFEHDQIRTLDSEAEAFFPGVRA